MGKNANRATPIAVAVVEHQGLFLVGKRASGATLSGMSEFPGGKIISGESPQEAAVRECQEEAGVDIQVNGVYPDVTYKYAHGEVHLLFFACSIVDLTQTPRPPFHWVNREELINLDFPKANGQLLGILLKGKKM